MPGSGERIADRVVKFGPGDPDIAVRSLGFVKPAVPTTFMRGELPEFGVPI
jgi:hypothetical protein